MPDDSSQGAGGEGDLFHQWLAHREGQGPPGQLRASTVPPKWAPKVVAPDEPPEPQPERGPEAAAAAAPEPAPEAAAVTAPVADPTPTQEDLAPVEPAAHEAAAASAPARPPKGEPAGDEPPVRLTFRPRTPARTAVGIGAVLAAASAVVLTIVALQERDEASTGIAVTLWVLTAIIWAVHSGTSVTRLSVRGGQLQVLRQGVRTTIDLASSYTPVEVHGRPGKHGWMVVFRRRDMTPFVIDQSMVDPTEFMRVLRYYRPEVDAS